MSKMVNIQKSERIKYIDALRGFTMILVVFGHVMFTSLRLNRDESIIGQFFLTFRMPMFFFISGFIAYKCLEKWNIPFYCEMMKKKMVVQLIPTFIFFSLYSISHHSTPLTFFHYGLNGYWFTIVLFEMFCIYYTISLVCVKSRYVDIGLAFFSIIGILWYFMGNHTFRICKVLSIENLSYYFQFFSIGILCRKYKHLFLMFLKNDNFRATIICTFVLLFFLIFDVNLKNNYSLIYKLNHDIFVRYFAFLMIFIFFYSKKEFFNSPNLLSKTLCWVGKRTLDIYLLHYFFLPVIPWIKPYIQSNNDIIIHLFIALFIALLVTGLCLITSEIIRTSNILAHYCFGVRRNNN